MKTATRTRLSPAIREVLESVKARRAPAVTNYERVSANYEKTDEELKAASEKERAMTERLDGVRRARYDALLTEASDPTPATTQAREKADKEMTTVEKELMECQAALRLLRDMAEIGAEPMRMAEQGMRDAAQSAVDMATEALLARLRTVLDEDVEPIVAAIAALPQLAPEARPPGIVSSLDTTMREFAFRTVGTGELGGVAGMYLAPRVAEIVAELGR